MQPLDGIRVVEAAGYISGPFAAMILADLGASVTKVEPPRGDPYRRFGEMRGEASLAFRGVNQNKTFVRLDLGNETELAEFRELLSISDVLITNWRPSVAPRHGLTAESVRKDFPNLIWVRVSGFGQDGPRAELPAFDSIVTARSGAMLSGAAEPIGQNNTMSDKITAMTAAQTATAALLERKRTGTGAVCDVAMVDAVGYFMAADIGTGHRVVGEEPDPYPADAFANDTTFATSDSWILLAPVSGKQLRNALQAVGQPEEWERVLADGPEQVWTNLRPILADAIAEHTTAHWDTAFADHDVPATPVLTMGEHLRDEQIVHNRLYAAEFDHGLHADWLQIRYPGRAATESE
jgi:crotonobetainyl-CoA:carnitine CoA-transferase CaiB-like acyl-CoA transferase